MRIGFSIRRASRRGRRIIFRLMKVNFPEEKVLHNVEAESTIGCPFRNNY